MDLVLGVQLYGVVSFFAFFAIVGDREKEKPATLRDILIAALWAFFWPIAVGVACYRWERRYERMYHHGKKGEVSPLPRNKRREDDIEKVYAYLPWVEKFQPNTKEEFKEELELFLKGFGLSEQQFIDILEFLGDWEATAEIDGEQGAYPVGIRPFIFSLFLVPVEYLQSNIPSP